MQGNTTQLTVCYFIIFEQCNIMLLFQSIYLPRTGIENPETLQTPPSICQEFDGFLCF